jgi:putative ABC transport system permease protein
MNDFTIIRRSLTARTLSTVFTTLSVAVAVGLMLVLLMMRDSGRKAFERGSGNMHLLVSAESDPLTSILNSVFYANPPRRPIEWPKFQQLQRVAPWEFFIPVQMGDSYRGLPVIASTPEIFSKFKPDAEQAWKLRDGRFFEKEFEIVLGSKAATETGLKIGDEVALTHGAPKRGEAEKDAPAPHVHDEFKFKVVGMLEPTGSAHDRALFIDVIGGWIIHAHDRREAEAHAAHGGGDDDHHDHGLETTAADLTDEDRKITAVYARVATRPGSDASAMIPPTFARLRADPTIQVAQPTQEINKLFQIVGSVDQILLAMAGVVMASSGVSILLALYNSMEQRRRQIAVLRVLGASRGRIFRLVLTESIVLGLIGSAIGVAVAFVGVRLVTAAMKERLGLVIDAGIEPRIGAMVVAGAIVVAYRTSVAKNLRPLG